MKRKIALSVILSFLVTGCAIDSDHPIPTKNFSNYNGDQAVVEARKSSLLDRILHRSDTLADESALSEEQILKIVEIEDRPPDILLDKKIEKLSLYSSSLGDAIKLILQDLPISFTVEPNVDLNSPITIQISNLNVYQALKRIAESAGYNIYYNKNRDSIIISRFTTHQYYIPSEIFLKKTASLQLGSSTADGASGTISPTVNLSPEDPAKQLKQLLNTVGTDEKIVTFDKDSGILSIKERPNFISEVDRIVKDFVLDRSKQFVVEFVVVEIQKKESEKLGMDLKNIVLRRNLFISSLAGTPLSTETFSSEISKGGVVISTSKNYSSITAEKPYDSNLAFKAFLELFNKYGTVEISERPNITLLNHTLGYLSIGSEHSYIKAVRVIPPQTTGGGVTTPAQTEYEVGTYRDGLQFIVRVDKYLKGNRIAVSLVPILANTTLRPGPNGQIQLLDRKIREMAVTAKIKDGDIIVLGGLKEKLGSGSKDTPYFSRTGWLSNIIGEKRKNLNKVETLFVVRVKELKRASDSRSIPSTRAKELIKNSGT